jgi:hypothetical protein
MIWVFVFKMEYGNRKGEQFPFAYHALSVDSLTAKFIWQREIYSLVKSYTKTRTVEE